MTFQHPADWTPLRDCEPPEEQLCVVLRMCEDESYVVFNAWLKKEKGGRLWWWSRIKEPSGKPMTCPTKLMKAAKANDYWFRLTLPVGSAALGEPPGERHDVYFESLDEQYRKRLMRAYSKRLVAMRTGTDIAAKAKKKAGKK